MKKFKIERLYPTEQYGNIKYSAEGLETTEEIKEVEIKFDELAKEYNKRREDEKTLKDSKGNLVPF